MLKDRLVGLCAVAALGLSLATPAGAGDSWDAVRASVFGARPIHDGHGVVTMEAPIRPEDMRVVPISTHATLRDGRAIKSVTFVIDENPTPVVADFKLGAKRDDVNIAVNFRVDRQSEARVIVEADDGQLYMASRLVKYAGGQSSCSAPPTGDPAEIAANMGKMTLTPAAQASPAQTQARASAELHIRHPNHTGMVMDQITLLYTPLKMVSEIAVSQAGEAVFTATGSIALSQDPKIAFDYLRKGGEMTVTFKDTDGGAWTRAFELGPDS